MSFESLGLSEKTLQAILSEGYTDPTPIQEQVIPLILQGKDVFGIAQTGTGKTASYCLPILDMLAQSRLRARLPRALVLAPTRELALQIHAAIETYGQNYQIKSAVVIGGESGIEQERALNKGVDIVIATPGRLLDTLSRGKVMLSAVEFLVIDEVDRMLDMGFIPDIEKIFTFMVKKQQTLLFSATVSNPIRKLIGKFLNNPIEIFITPSSQTADTIEQHQVLIPARQKRQALRYLLVQENVQQAIIFCNRKTEVSTLCASLLRHGYKAGMLHGDLTQGARTETLNAFKQGEINFLVASDIAARGIDIDDLSYVFNFDVPNNAEEYVHRIGRTGRAGKTGKTFMFVSENDKKLLPAVEKLIGKEIAVFPLGEEFEKIADTEKAKPKPRRRKKTTPNLPVDNAVVVSEPIATQADEKMDEKSAVTEPARQPKSESESHSSTRRHSHKTVVGFGDEVPAFFHLSWPGIISASPATNATNSLD